MPMCRKLTCESAKPVIRLGGPKRRHYARRAADVERTPMQAQALRETLLYERAGGA